MICATISNVVPAEGLVANHAYSITKVVRAEIKTGLINLIRIRNPWGSETEWKGAWSDGSKEWEDLPAEQQEHLGLNPGEDGEFWMPLEDFMKQFHREDYTSRNLPLRGREEWGLGNLLIC